MILVTHSLLFPAHVPHWRALPSWYVSAAAQYLMVVTVNAWNRP